MEPPLVKQETAAWSRDPKHFITSQVNDSGPMDIQLLILSFAKKNDMERLPFTQVFASRKLTEERRMEK